MDELSLAVLKAEMQADCAAICEAAETARERFALQSQAGLEGCAYHLARAYNILEQLLQRAAKAFENRIEDASGWHTELLRRWTLRIPGVRPPLVPDDLLLDLHELRGFRHVFRHAYALVLDRERVARVLEAAARTAAAMPGACAAFVREVAEEQGWKAPD